MSAWWKADKVASVKRVGIFVPVCLCILHFFSMHLNQLEEIKGSRIDRHSQQLDDIIPKGAKVRCCVYNSTVVQQQGSRADGAMGRGRLLVVVAWRRALQKRRAYIHVDATRCSIALTRWLNGQPLLSIKRCPGFVSHDSVYFSRQKLGFKIGSYYSGLQLGRSSFWPGVPESIVLYSVYSLSATVEAGSVLLRKCHIPYGTRRAKTHVCNKHCALHHYIPA